MAATAAATTVSTTVATDDKSWIKISSVATTAGMVAAALTYAATAKATSAAATASGLTLDAISAAASAGARLAFGEVAGVTVRVLGAAASRTAEESVRQGGVISAAAAAAAAGAATALTVTIGGHAIHYTMEYGGKITREMAEKFSELYIKYRLENKPVDLVEPTILEIEDGDAADVSGSSAWLVVGCGSGSFDLKPVGPTM